MGGAILLTLVLLAVGCGGTALNGKVTLDPGSEPAGETAGPGADFAGMPSQTSQSRNFVLTTAEQAEDRMTAGGYVLEMK